MEKRTTIFSIFVFLCLLTNSTYARTTEYENPKDTILDMMLYFDLKARQADKDYQGNGLFVYSRQTIIFLPLYFLTVHHPEAVLFQQLCKYSLSGDEFTGKVSIINLLYAAAGAS